MLWCMSDREVLLFAVSELRDAANILERANDAEMLGDVDALVRSAAAKLRQLRS